MTEPGGNSSPQIQVAHPETTWIRDERSLLSPTQIADLRATYILSLFQVPEFLLACLLHGSG